LTSRIRNMSIPLRRRKRTAPSMVVGAALDTADR